MALYQEKRAGRLFKEREVCHRYKIDLVQNEANRVRPISSNLRAHNPGNCVHIPLTASTYQGKRSETVYCPSLLLSNAMSLVPKIDEIYCVAQLSNLYLHN